MDPIELIKKEKRVFESAARQYGARFQKSSDMKDLQRCLLFTGAAEKDEALLARMIEVENG